MTAAVAGATVPAPSASYGAAPTGSGLDLLPPPGAGAPYESALAAIYTCLSRLRDTGLALGEADVLSSKDQQAKALSDELAAIRREAQNQSDSGGGFFDSIGKLVSDVAHDIVQGNLQGAVGDAGSDLAGAWNSPRFWRDLQVGLGEISVVAAAVSEVSEEIGGPVGAKVSVVASSVDEGAALGAELAAARGESFAATAKSAEADAVADKAALARLQSDVAKRVDGAKCDDQTLSRALTVVAGALVNRAASLVTATAVKG